MRLRSALFAAIAIVGVSGTLASSASATAPNNNLFGIESFTSALSDSAAGTHADFTTTLVFNHEGTSGFANLEDVTVDLPPGLIGNPTATPKCPLTQFAGLDCPINSQVGLVRILIDGEIESYEPLYNLEPSTEEEPARFGFFSLIFLSYVNVHLRPDDLGVEATVSGIGGPAKPIIAETIFWARPADPIHDKQRFKQEETIFGQCGKLGYVCEGPAEGRPFDGPNIPFMRNPTACQSQSVSADVTSYEAAGHFTASASLPNTTNCDELEFEPRLTARPTTNAADSPSGLTVDLQIPQNEDPDGVATSDLRRAEVVLPEGLVVNPSSANGLAGCSPDEIGLTTAVGSAPVHFDAAPAACPDASSLGAVEVDTPLLPEPLKGTAYLATPRQNPFGSLLAIYLAIEGQGVVIKLPGLLRADPQTGRLTAIFDENPQLPFEDLRLNLFAGAFAPLRTPASCGQYSTTSTMTPWGAPGISSRAPSDTYEIAQGPNGAPCGAPASAQTFEAGSVAPIAGQYRPFVINLRREDGSPQFAALTVTPPPGLVARLAGTPICSDAALAAAAVKDGRAEDAQPSCPAASQIGSVYIQAGAGPAPFNAPGKVYLTGPYKGAPLGLAVVTPAVAGPFDLGTVVVRTALRLNPVTAQVSAVSDPIPTILQGIPLDIRSVSLRLDKPGFTLNPTSCDPTQVGGSLLSTSGAVNPLQSRFQLAECGQLKLKPKLTLRLKGASKRGGYPALTAVVSNRTGDANIESAQVTLPHSEFLAQNHIKTVCTRVQFAAEACPPGSVYGRVSVLTPLLDFPLTGPVYLRSSSNQLPDLVLDLHGPASQPIHFEAAARIDSVNGGIRNTFTFVPDVPFSKLTLQLPGGKKSLITNSRNICASSGKATAAYTSHNGLAYETQTALKAKCGHHKKKKSSGPRKHRR